MRGDVRASTLRYICMYVYICTHICVCVYVCVSERVCVSVCIFILNEKLSVPRWLWFSIFMYVCIYIHI